MDGADAELETFRREVSCAAILERIGGWTLDQRESTRNALKYRRGKGEIVIVNHDGRGWWDPCGPGKGDVFGLVQHLEPSLNFGAVRKVLRQLVGVTPTYPTALTYRERRGGEKPVPIRWNSRPPLKQGSPGWRYLQDERGLSARTLSQAVDRDVVRDGIDGSVWFAHRSNGAVSHVDVRGPRYKGALAGGRKTLFFLPSTARPNRIVVTEGAIDALSVADIEGTRADTLYTATGGGIGPGTVAALSGFLHRIVRLPSALFVSATDANEAGDAFATAHAALVGETGIAFERLRPPEGQDWNDVVRSRRGA